jgi:ABC-2 type transport system permease protein
MSFMRLFIYRANFVSSLISTVVWGLFLFFSMFVITAQAPNAYGWQRVELMLFISAYSFVIGFFHMLFSKNFESLSTIILQGDLDGVLVKPIDSQFFVSTRDISILSSFRIWLGLGSALYFFSLGNIFLTLYQWLSLVLLLFCALIIIYSIWMIVCSCLIWIPRANNLVQLMYSITGFSRFPKQMYASLGTGAYLFFLPLIMIFNPVINSIVTIPSFSTLAISFLFTLLVFVLCRYVWLLGLKHYSSASS